MVSNFLKLFYQKESSIYMNYYLLSQQFSTTHSVIKITNPKAIGNITNHYSGIEKNKI
jgi:hypothetical protein